LEHLVAKQSQIYCREGNEKFLSLHGSSHSWVRVDQLDAAETTNGYLAIAGSRRSLSSRKWRLAGGPNVDAAKSTMPDPRIALLAQYEAGLMAYIRERYNCPDEAARQVRRLHLDWEMDAAETGIVMGPEGKLFLTDNAVNSIDGYALKIGLRPAAKMEGQV
jgi:hypothetical protein